MKHTPAPWTAMDNGQFLEVRVPWKGDTEVFDHSPLVCSLSYVGNDGLDGHANAAFIVRAVNSHAALIKSLRDIAANAKAALGGDAMEWAEELGDIERDALAAIAAAEAQP